MDQRAYRCHHGQLNGLGPQCYSKCRQVAEPAPAQKLEPTVVPVARAPKARMAKVVVTNSGAVTNAARQSRWRSKQDVVALRGQAQERMKGLRARRKAGKAVAS